MLITGISTDLQGREIRAMTNEWLEFKAYTDDPVFSAENKQSTAFIGRFTVRMIKQNKGFNRIFTILARGYLFHNVIVLLPVYQIVSMRDACHWPL